MTAMFRVDASAQSGLGHLMRCQALAQALVQVHEQCVFVVNAGIRDWCLSRHDWVGRVEALPGSLTLQDEITWLEQCSKKFEARLLVLDGYQYDEHYRYAVSSLPLLHVCFDDTAALSAYYADVIINPALTEDSRAYQHSAPEATLCLGEQYRVLRQEFIQPPSVAWQDRQNLTIAMGGSDPANLTLPLLKTLEKQCFPGLIRVITGAAYPFTDDLKTFLQQTPLHVQHVHDCQQMADAFAHSRLVLSAAGGTQFELAACGAPAQLVVVADNQLFATEHAKQQGWCRVYNALDRQQFSVSQIAEETQSLWQQDEQLRGMSERALLSAYAHGALHVVDKIGQCLKASACR